MNSSFALIPLGKRELIASFKLSSCCHATVSVPCLCLTVWFVGLQFVIVVFCWTLSFGNCAQRMQESLLQTADAGLTIRQRIQESLLQTADAGVSLSDSGYRRLSIRQLMHETLYQTADAGDSPSDSGCRSLSIGQRMLDSLSDSGCRSLSFRQRMQESL